MTRLETWSAGVAVLLLVAACGATTAPPPSAATVVLAPPEADAAEPPGSSAEPTASSVDERPPVPAQVADLHRTVFAPSEKPVPGGGVQCLITVHDGRLSHDQFHAVVLFVGGAVATWTQSPTGRVEPFLAKLTPEEDAHARRLLEGVAAERNAAGDRFGPSTTVLGISTRPGERVETAYFASDETPDPLDRLLKHRLEATNAP